MTQDPSALRTVRLPFIYKTSTNNGGSLGLWCGVLLLQLSLISHLGHLLPEGSRSNNDCWLCQLQACFLLMDPLLSVLPTCEDKHFGSSLLCHGSAHCSPTMYPNAWLSRHQRLHKEQANFQYQHIDLCPQPLTHPTRGSSSQSHFCLNLSHLI